MIKLIKRLALLFLLIQIQACGLIGMSAGGNMFRKTKDLRVSEKYICINSDDNCGSLNNYMSNENKICFEKYGDTICFNKSDIVKIYELKNSKKSGARIGFVFDGVLLGLVVWLLLVTI